MSSVTLRREALSLYRKLIRASRTWTNSDTSETVKEREYIKTETRRLFRENSKITDEQTIKLHLREGETRLELAYHYENPYPRISNIPQNQLPPTSKRKFKGRQKVLEQAKPVYLKSYKETE